MPAVRPAVARAPGTARPPGAAAPLVGALGIEATAHAVGVSPSSLRLWERQGLIRPQRTRGGLRRYRPEDVARLREIRRWRTVEGLNAAAIRRLLRSSGGTDGIDRAGGTEGADGIDAADGATHALPRSTPGRARPRRTPERLRALRTNAHLTLREAAAGSGLSVSFISGLERGLTGASIAALRRLTAVYGTTLGGLLEEPAVGRLVHPGDRRVLDTGSGVRIEHLASSTVALEPQLFVLEPGASSDGAYSHPGEEFMYVLDGDVAVWLGDSEVYRLTTGDALTFPSTVTHRFQALGDAATRLLWINTPPTF
jgi:DNA-binding transcriptional MerR regulator/quercetin dioxygenase-like cupin family protein